MATAKKTAPKKKVKKALTPKRTKKAKSPKVESDKALSLGVLNIDGKKVSQFDLDPEVFDGTINMQLMHQAVVIYQGNQRMGLASSKTRGDVSGGGKKPWRQKGTGRARFGSSRNPVWRGGGVAFGPKPHSFYKDMPKKMKALALKSALNAKLRDAEIMVLEEVPLVSHKTKKLAEIIKKLKLNQEKVRLVVKDLENNLKLASNNLAKLKVSQALNIPTIDVLDCKRLVMTKDALKTVEERIKKCLA
ncbi:MAG: 50S ribosomal protein L4 [Candidatus Omnitrophica bacterium]|nr:50S ribosomal protein L4 [Candidatus Omnitrophota bacterium]MBU2044594.1 50S ribosomal protein L4 [Candidatus Omnitrophota bacterium]MBU2251218.1 50S ribosomal protein L4 [Candidatus Omnitrophota bacterium]MBU2265873.1 50S ribosomal protein L4 [Candidatus Omnitrophota bacterium]MBU2474120.1 50S ribosomal protein L4 [Candidatus Omnitrophota bacterium]